MSFVKQIAQPGGNVTLLFGVSALGGRSPCNFVAKWGDGAVQTDTTGVFTRTFASNQTIPATAYITVISGDDQSANTTATFSSSS